MEMPYFTCHHFLRSCESSLKKKKSLGNQRLVTGSNPSTPPAFSWMPCLLSAPASLGACSGTGFQETRETPPAKVFPMFEDSPLDLAQKWHRINVLFVFPYRQCAYSLYRSYFPNIECLQQKPLQVTGTNLS